VIVASAANNNGTKDVKQLQTEIKEWRASVHERLAVVRETAADWRRWAEALRRNGY